MVAHGLPDPKFEENDTSDTPLMRFIEPIVTLRHSIKGVCTIDTLIEENVKASVKHVVESEAMRDSWARAGRGEGKKVWVHGWVSEVSGLQWAGKACGRMLIHKVYDIKSGLLRDLGISVGPPSHA